MGIKAWTAACVAALAMACAGAANAEVLFTSIPDLSAVPFGVWNVTTPTTVATQFTLTSAETISSFELVDNSTADWVPIRILSDNHGSPGEVLFAGSFDPSHEWSVQTAHGTRIVGGLASLSFTLPAGTYWFGVSSLDDTTETVGRFFGSAPTVVCMQFGNVCSPDAGKTIGFSIIGYPPGTAVPEPATWAMLLFGVALMGAALRRHPALSVISASSAGGVQSGNG